MATRKDLQHELAQFDLDKRQLQLEERKLQLEEQKLQLERKVLDTKRRLLSLNTVDLTDPETQVKSESRESSSQIDQKSFAAGLDAAHATEGSSFIPGNSSRHSTQESSKTVEASENVKEVTVASEKIVDKPAYTGSVKRPTQTSSAVSNLNLPSTPIDDPGLLETVLRPLKSLPTVVQAADKNMSSHTSITPESGSSLKDLEATRFKPSRKSRANIIKRRRITQLKRSSPSNTSSSDDSSHDAEAKSDHEARKKPKSRRESRTENKLNAVDPDVMTELEELSLIAHYTDLFLKHMQDFQLTLEPSNKKHAIATRIRNLNRGKTHSSITLLHREYTSVAREHAKSPTLCASLLAELEKFENALPYWSPKCRGLPRQKDRMTMISNVIENIVKDAFTNADYKEFYDPHKEI